MLQLHSTFGNGGNGGNGSGGGVVVLIPEKSELDRLLRNRSI